MLTERALNGWIANKLRAAFARWDRAIEERQLNRELATLAGSHWRGGVLAMAWRAWREAPLAAAMHARAKRHSKRKTLARVLRLWCFTVASSHLDYHTNLLADDHRRQKTLGKAFPAWIDVARAALASHLADQMAAMAAQHWESNALALSFRRWRDEARSLRQQEEHDDRAAVHRLWRLGVDCCRAWRRHTRHRVAEEAAYDAAVSLDSRRRRRRVMSAWLRHTLAAYVGREGLARRALAVWRRNTEEAFQMWDKTTAAEEYSSYRRKFRAWNAWLHAWLLEARAALAAENRASNLVHGAFTTWLTWARVNARSRINDELAAAHHHARTLGRCFAAMAHAWARRVLLRAFVSKRRRGDLAAAWSAWRNGKRQARESLWTPFTWWAEYTYNRKLQRLQEQRWGSTS